MTERLVSASDLKRQRGWSEGLLDTLLGAPDALGANPHGFRPPQRFFRLDRVLEAESDRSFSTRVEALSEQARWRREHPTRTSAPGEIDHLEWLDDPWRMRLFLTPKRPKLPRRRREPAPVVVPTDRFEVMRLFDVRPYSDRRAAQIRG